MTHTTQSLRHAGTAIAAVLAIASTPSLAQDPAAPFPAAPEPVIVVPDIPAPVVPAPTVVLPTELPEPAPVPQPSPEASVVQPVPEPSPASRTESPRPMRAIAAERTVPAADPAPPAAAPIAADEPAILPPAETIEPVAATPLPPVAAEPPARGTTADDAGLLALVLGGLAFLALAIWAFIAIGRRKPVRRYAAADVAPKPAPVTPKPVVAEPAPVVVHEPVTVEAAHVAEARVQPMFAPVAATSTGGLAHAGASVALPRRVPETYAERDALMKRMIAARPDRANPFTDRGARTRRARLILQSLGRDFGDVEPWIDLSQYPNNWPELARKRSAAA